MSNRNHRESPAPTSSPGSAPAPDGQLLLVPLFGRACSCGYDDDTTRHGSLASSLFGRARCVLPPSAATCDIIRP